MPALPTAQIDPSRQQCGDPALLQALATPAMYPGVPRVAVHETHASWVFVAGEHAYKVKKPLALGFLDYSTLALRHSACREEVRVNQELAPGLYLGVRAIVRSEDGFRIVDEGAPDAVEYVVEMRTLQRGGHVRRPDRGGLSHPGARHGGGSPAGSLPPLRGRGGGLGRGSGARAVAAERARSAACRTSGRVAPGCGRRLRRGLRERARARVSPAGAARPRPRRSWGPALRACAGRAPRPRRRSDRVRPRAAQERHRVRPCVPGDGSRGQRAALGSPRARQRIPRRGHGPRW